MGLCVENVNVVIDKMYWGPYGGCNCTVGSSPTPNLQLVCVYKMAGIHLNMPVITNLHTKYIYVLIYLSLSFCMSS